MKTREDEIRSRLDAMCEANGVTVFHQSAYGDVIYLLSRVEKMESVVKAVKKYRDGMKYNACGCYLTDRNELFDAFSALDAGKGDL